MHVTDLLTGSVVWLLSAGPGPPLFFPPESPLCSLEVEAHVAPCRLLCGQP